MDGRTAAAVLGGAPGTTRQELVRAYRARAKETHPDAAGSDEAFVLLRTAFEQLLANLDRQNDAPSTATPAEPAGLRPPARPQTGAGPWITVSGPPPRPVLDLTDTPVVGPGPAATSGRAGGAGAPVHPPSDGGARRFAACLDAALARRAA